MAEKTNVGVDFLKLDEVRLLEVGTPQHSACSESFWQRAGTGRDRPGRLGMPLFAYQSLYLANQSDLPSIFHILIFWQIFFALPV